MNEQLDVETILRRINLRAQEELRWGPAEALEIDTPLDPADPDCTLDSLDIAELSILVEQEFDIEISDQELSNIRATRDVVGIVQRKAKP